MINNRESLHQELNNFYTFLTSESFKNRVDKCNGMDELTTSYMDLFHPVVVKKRNLLISDIIAKKYKTHRDVILGFGIMVDDDNLRLKFKVGNIDVIYYPTTEVFYIEGIQGKRGFDNLLSFMNANS